jgi:hypothetical protein
MKTLESDLQPVRAARSPLQSARQFAAGQKPRLWSLTAEWWRDDSITFDWKAALAAVVGGLLLAPLAYYLPTTGLDWLGCFLNPANPCGQMPWVSPVTTWLLQWDWRVELAILNGVTLSTVAVAVAREAKDRPSRLLAVAMAILSPPVLILVWVGQIDALGLLGLLAMPAGLPLLLMKPHVYGWALLSRKWWFGIAVALLAASFLIWGWWVPRVIAPPGPSRNESPIAMGWEKVGWHILIIGLVLMFFSHRDPYRLIAAGTLVTPYLQPYHLVALLPALGRVQGRERWLLWGAAWLSAVPDLIWTAHIVLVPGFDLWSWSHGVEPWFMPVARHIALIFPVLAWWFLRPAESLKR